VGHLPQIALVIQYLQILSVKALRNKVQFKPIIVPHHKPLRQHMIQMLAKTMNVNLLLRRNLKRAQVLLPISNPLMIKADQETREVPQAATVSHIRNDDCAPISIPQCS
jgi:hypothetical protein